MKSGRSSQTDSLLKRLNINEALSLGSECKDYSKSNLDNQSTLILLSLILYQYLSPNFLRSEFLDWLHVYMGIGKI